MGDKLVWFFPPCRLGFWKIFKYTRDIFFPQGCLFFEKIKAFMFALLNLP